MARRKKATSTSTANAIKPYEVFNVATDDYITVRQIADLAVVITGLRANEVRYDFAGGDRGWKGDVPIVRLDTARIRGLGWRCEHSTREALRRSMLAMIPDMQAGRM